MKSLLDTEGSLSEHLSSEEANKKSKAGIKKIKLVFAIIEGNSRAKAIIAKYTAENVVVKSIQCFQKYFLMMYTKRV